MSFLQVRRSLCSVFLLKAVSWVMVLSALDLAVGISWLAVPDEHIKVEQGRPFSLHWHYKMDDNETYLSSNIGYFVEFKLYTFIASRHLGENTYYRYLAKYSILGKNKVTLIVNSTKIGNNITYCCQVERKLVGDKEEDRRCSKVFVYAVPRITNQTTQLSCKQGDRIKLQCNTTGFPSPQVEWIHDDTHQRIGSSSHILLNITGKKSGGRYCCVADNGFGRDTACTAVNVTEYEPVNTKLSVKHTNILDNMIRIKCEAVASPPANPFIMTIDDKEYNSSDGLYTIKVPAARKDKIYHIAVSCIPFNKYGQGPIKKVVFQVYVRSKSPEITNPYKQVILVNEGKDVSLVCNASGYPAPNITWTKHGTVIGVGRISNITRVKRNDSSCYTCTADNGFGHAKNASICLDVQYLKDHLLNVKDGKKILFAVLGVLFVLSIVLNIILMAGILCSRRKDSKEYSGNRSNNSFDERSQINDLTLQETSFNVTDNETPNLPEYEEIGATSNAVATTITQLSQPHSGVQRNYPMPQYEGEDQHGQTEAVSNPPPLTYQTIQHCTGNYDSLSLSTRLPPKGTALSSTGSPTRTGEYQALQHKGVSPQYQSLDDLSKC